MTEQGGFWDDAVVVHTYTDGEAVEDGVLVAVSETDRVTRAAWEWLRERMGPAEQPPAEWVIDLGTWVAGSAMVDAGQRADLRAASAARGVIGTNEAQARKVYEENIGGGIFTFEHSGMTFWLIPNELGGITMMFPEDY